MKLAFAGLGRMGLPMARNLAAAGHHVSVWNRSADKAAELDLPFASTPAEAAAGADVVFTMLADDKATESVAFGPHGIASTLPAGSIHISCSTISTQMARRLVVVHSQAGQGYLSAPVFGRPEAADSGKLLVVAAGPAPLIERVEPLFAAIGRQTFIAGPEPWQANMMKLCGNMTIASMIETFGEAFAALRKAGIDPAVFMETMNQLYASPVYRNYGSLILDERFDPAGFALKLALKDVRLLLAAADEWDAPLPIANLLRDNLLAALANGQGDLDWSSFTRIAARNAGV